MKDIFLKIAITFLIFVAVSSIIAFVVYFIAYVALLLVAIICIGMIVVFFQGLWEVAGDLLVIVRGRNNVSGN